jgi:hypothetical protein
MPEPTTLSAAHLSAAVVPISESPDLALTRAVHRVDQALLLSDALRGRLPWLPPPAAQETLGELVQVARRRLREDRVRVQSDELGARRTILTGVRAELTP